MLLCISPARAGEEYIHTIVEGDTLITLGELLLKRPDDWPRIQKLNGVNDPYRLVPGEKLRYPVELLRTVPSPAQVVASRGSVRAGKRKVAVGDVLPVGSVIETGSDGFVTVGLADGSRFTVEANTSVTLEQLRRLRVNNAQTFQLAIPRGRVENEVSTQRGPAARYEIRTPSATIAVRGTAFRIAVDARGTTSRAEVTHGTVAVGAKDGTLIEVPEGFGTLARKGESPIAVPLLPPPDLSSLPTVLPRAGARVSFPVVDDAHAYRMQIAADAGFVDVISDRSAAQARFDLPALRSGKWWLRVRAIDAQGMEGRDAQLAFEVDAAKPAALRPRPDAVLTGESVTFVWRGAVRSARFRFEVAQDDTFSTVLKSLDTADSQFTLPLAPGNYAWRLAYLGSAGQPGTWSSVRRFSVRPPLLKIDGVEANSDGVHARWDGGTGVRFEVELAKDTAFKQLVTSTLVDTGQFEWPRIDSGRYWIRVRALGSDGQRGPWTPSQSFDVSTWQP